MDGSISSQKSQSWNQQLYLMEQEKQSNEDKKSQRNINNL